MVTVTCTLLGRLGNNLFQVAAMVGTGQKFAIPEGYHHKEIYNFFPKLPVQEYWRRKFKQWDQPDFTYTPIPYDTDPYNKWGTKIHGFFQSIKYFEHCQDEVRSWLPLNETPIDYVGLHWRRGDYLQYPDRFPTLTPEYIGQAIDYFNFKGFRNFMVFSDDIQYCKEFLPKRFPYVNYKFSEGKNQFEDLSLMASCEHNIIANSSFSWMAAWYNRNKNKIVITPSKETWFGPNNKLDTRDLIPEGWIQLHNK
jgi:hypothetical protein